MEVMPWLKSKIDWKDKTFLVAEDEETNYYFIEAALRKTEVTLIWAKDGKEAVDICNSNQKIDLVLMDIRMPDMNGFEATAKIKQIRSKLPVIVQTAYAKQYAKDDFMKANFDGFLTKPFKVKQLISIIKKHL